MGNGDVTHPSTTSCCGAAAAAAAPSPIVMAHGDSDDVNGEEDGTENEDKRNNSDNGTSTCSAWWNFAPSWLPWGRHAHKKKNAVSSTTSQLDAEQTRDTGGSDGGGTSNNRVFTRREEVRLKTLRRSVVVGGWPSASDDADDANEDGQWMLLELALCALDDANDDDEGCSSSSSSLQRRRRRRQDVERILSASLSTRARRRLNDMLRRSFASLSTMQGNDDVDMDGKDGSVVEADATEAGNGAPPRSDKGANGDSKGDGIETRMERSSDDQKKKEKDEGDEEDEELFMKEVARLLCRTNPHHDYSHQHGSRNAVEDDDHYETTAAKAARLIHDAAACHSHSRSCTGEEETGEDTTGDATTRTTTATARARDVIELCYNCAVACRALDRYYYYDSYSNYSNELSNDANSEEGVASTTTTSSTSNAPSPTPSSASLEPLIRSLLSSHATSSSAQGITDEEEDGIVTQEEFVRWVDGNNSSDCCNSDDGDGRGGPVSRIVLTLPALLERIFFPPPPSSSSSSSGSSNSNHSSNSNNSSSRPARHLVHFPRLAISNDRRCSQKGEEEGEEDDYGDDCGPIFQSCVDPSLFVLGCMDRPGFDGKWHRIFSTAEDGTSLNRLEHAVIGFRGPTVLLIKAYSPAGGASITFGAYVSTPWKKRSKSSSSSSSCFFGDGRCFLFVLDPIVRLMRARPSQGSRGGNYVYFHPGDGGSGSGGGGLNNKRNAASPDEAHGLGFGWTARRPRLFVESTLDRCRFGWHDSSYEPGGPSIYEGGFNNDMASSSSLFGASSFSSGGAGAGAAPMLDVDALEIYGLGDDGSVADALDARNRHRDTVAHSLDKARQVDKAAFLGDLRSGMIESKAFAHRRQIDGRANGCLLDDDGEDKE